MRIFPDVRLDGLSASRGEMLRYLGYRGQALEGTMLEAVERCAALAEQSASPRFVAEELSPVRITEEGAELEGLLLPGEDMGVTLGTQMERLIQYHRRRSMADAVMIDAAATALIEAACDQVEEGLRAFYRQKELDVTDRFSCGYGDLPLETQPDIVRLLDAPRAIGLTCSSSLILIPQKSVTAILGVIPAGTHRSVRGCQSCKNRQNCQYRKEGIFCGHSSQASQ